MMMKYNKRYILWGTLLCCTPLLYGIKTKEKIASVTKQNIPEDVNLIEHQQTSSVSHKKDKEEAYFWALVHLLSVCKIQ
ncbi:MAG: hypothetical protein WD055_03230 [Candidatus Dependentiae bacterium]